MAFSRDLGTVVHSEAVVAGSWIPQAVVENNYWAFSFFTMILPEIRHSFPTWGGSGPLWNYLDSASSLVMAGIQFTDDETHRPKTSKRKGFVNGLSGGQLLIVTTLALFGFGASYMAGAGFAASFAAGFVLSLDDTIRACRRRLELDYWIEDSFNELIKIPSNIEKLEGQIAALKDVTDETLTGKALIWAREQKQQRVIAYKKQLKQIEEDFLWRLAWEKHNTNGGKVANFLDNHQRLKYFSDDFFKIEYNTIMNINIKDLEKTKYTRQACERQIDDIHSRCTQEAIVSGFNSVLWAFACTGMVLSLIPGCHLLGLGMIAAVSATYLIKNLLTLGYNAFFKPKLPSISEKSEQPTAAMPGSIVRVSS